jgi:hypothetical protein
LITAMSFVLLLFSNGALEGYKHHENLSDCLEVKRKIKRHNGMAHGFEDRWVCQRMKVELAQGPDGRWNIRRLLDGVKK